jgi:phosphopantetheine adenylyltransferase
MLAALKAAYHPCLTAAVKKLASLKLPTAARLEVVVPYGGRYSPDVPRSHIFGPVQQLLAGLYSLICIICAELSVETDSPGGVDARIIILSPEDARRSYDAGIYSSKSLAHSGPIIDLQSFALARRRWRYIFGIDGEPGEALLGRYIHVVNQTSPPLQGEIYRIPGGVIMNSPNSAPSVDEMLSSTAHTTVAIGGTFDHLHAGHKLLLTSQALMMQPAQKDSDQERRLIIGITGDEMLKNKKYAAYLMDWQQRQGDVVDFLLSVLSFSRKPAEDIETTSYNESVVNGRAVHTRLRQSKITIECVEIQDPYGPTITDESITALVVSGETRSGGKAVNDRRMEKGWKSLEVFEVDVLDTEEDTDGKQTTTATEEFASKISSTAIRKRRAEMAHTNGSLL